MGVLSALLGQYAAVDALASYVLPEWGDWVWFLIVGEFVLLFTCYCCLYVDFLFQY